MNIYGFYFKNLDSYKDFVDGHYTGNKYIFYTIEDSKFNNKAAYELHKVVSDSTDRPFNVPAGSFIPFSQICNDTGYGLNTLIQKYSTAEHYTAYMKLRKDEASEQIEKVKKFQTEYECRFDDDRDHIADALRFNGTVTGRYKTYNPKGSNKMKNQIDKVVNKNSRALKDAAVLTLGKSVNKVAVEKVAPLLPLMVRGYADTPVGKVVLANLVAAAVDNFSVTNPQARVVADAMVQAAMVDFVESFNVDDIVQELMNNIDPSKLAAVQEASES